MATLANVHVTAAVPPTTPPAAAPTPGLVESKNEELLQYVERTFHEYKEFHFLRFEKLQRINLVALQKKLIRTKDALSKASTISDDDLEKLRTNLEQYGKQTPVASHGTFLTDVSDCNTKLPLLAGKKESSLKRGSEKRTHVAALFPRSDQRHRRIEI